MRRVYVLLTVVCVAAVVYVSLRPFRFTPVSWDDAVGELVEFTFRRPIRAIDVVRNVAALVPLGFFLSAALSPDGVRARMVRRGLGVVACVAALSICLEVAQAFVRVRIVSGRDVAAQVIGAASGVAAWALAGARVTRFIERLTTLRSVQRERDRSHEERYAPHG